MPIDQGGVPSNNSTFIIFLANINDGGMKLPIALAAFSNVTFVPRSALEILFTHPFPFVKNTFSGLFGTAEISVSSMLKMDIEDKL